MRRLVWLLLLTATAFGQTYSNQDDITTGWTTFHDTTGAGSCSGTTLTFNNATPSIDGGSMLIPLSGCSNFSNYGFYRNLGANNTATYFTIDQYYYLSSLTGLQAQETDQFQYLFSGDGGATQNTRLYWGTQCVVGGVWDVWDAGGVGWVSTGVSCNLGATGQYHHLTIKVHRISGDTSGTGGYPKEYYDSISLDGTIVVSNQVTNAGALPGPDVEQTGFMEQLDTNGSCSSCSVSESLDEITATQSNNYYVSAAGSDSNNGRSKSTPWAHAPGMPNFSGSYTHVAGDQIIFRGGDTWHFGIAGNATSTGGTWSWANSGASGNPDYIGVDQTWFTGSSWVRPVMNGDNPLWTGSGFPASCTHAESGDQFYLNGVSYATLDNFEWTGFCWTGQASINGAFIDNPGGNAHIIISNHYAHGWTMTSGASDNFPFIQSYGTGSGTDFNQYVSLVVDGSDSPHFAGGSANCQYHANDSAGCASGQGINGAHAYDVHQSIFRYVSNIDVDSDCHTRHDNLYEYLYDTFASGSVQQHSNVMNCLGGASGDPLYFYNNIVRHTFTTQAIYFAIRNNLYVYGNIFYDNMNSIVGPESGACLRLNSTNSSLSTLVNAYFYGNTFGDNTCYVQLAPVNSPLYAFSGTVFFQDNHFIGASGSALSNWYYIDTNSSSGCVSGGTCTITDNGSELYQTTSVANGQGYTASNLYQPTSGGSSIGAGANLTSSCSTFGTSLCSGSSGAVTETSGNGGQIASYPAIPIVARPSSGAWDTGAYEFASSTTCNAPTFSPPTGSYTGSQSVAISSSNCSGITYCIGTGCTPSTTYSGVLTVASSETIGAFATQSGSTQSSTAYAAYSLTTPSYLLTVVVTVGGTTVTSSPAGINCAPVSGSCLGLYSSVVLTQAGPAPGYQFTQWYGAVCSEGKQTASTCTTTLTGAVTISAGYTYAYPQAFIGTSAVTSTCNALGLAPGTGTGVCIPFAPSLNNFAVNQSVYDASLGSANCGTLIWDFLAGSGNAVGNVTVSGGASDVDSSLHANFMGIAAVGNFYLLSIIPGPCGQVANVPTSAEPYDTTGVPAATGGAVPGTTTTANNISGNFAFSRVSDGVFYSESSLNCSNTTCTTSVPNGSTSAYSVIYKGVIQNQANTGPWTAGPITTNPINYTMQPIFDARNCAGLGAAPSALTGHSGSILSVVGQDNAFLWAVSYTGAQDTARYSFVYTPSPANCKTLDVQTGYIYSCSSFPCDPTQGSGNANYVGTETTCTIGSGVGIHDQGGKSSQYVTLGAAGTWTCMAAYSTTNSQLIWHWTDTAVCNTLPCPNGPTTIEFNYNAGSGHGVSAYHTLMSFNDPSPDIRQYWGVLSNGTAFTGTFCPTGGCWNQVASVSSTGTHDTMTDDPYSLDIGTWMQGYEGINLNTGNTTYGYDNPPAFAYENEVAGFINWQTNLYSASGNPTTARFYHNYGNENLVANCTANSAILKSPGAGHTYCTAASTTYTVTATSTAATFSVTNPFPSCAGSSASTPCGVHALDVSTDGCVNSQFNLTNASMVSANGTSFSLAGTFTPGTYANESCVAIAKTLNFGCADGILYASQDGNWAVTGYGGYGQLGADNVGAQFCSAMLVRLTPFALATPNTRLTGAFPPFTIQSSGCKGGIGGANTQGFCDVQYWNHPHETGVLAQVSASAVDTGTSGPLWNFTSTDNKLTPFTTGYALASISTSGGIASATFTSGAGVPFMDGVVVWVTGTGPYAGAHTLLTGGSTWSGNVLTQVQWLQAGSPAACSSSCGSMVDAFGGSVPGYSAALGHVEIVVQHSTTGPNTGIPQYVLTQAWANKVAQLSPWTAAAQHPVHDLLYVGTHYYHETAVVATVGYCTSAGTIPTFNTSGGSTTDGTCAWLDDGTSNALPLEVVSSGFSGGYAGCNNSPAGCYVPSTTLVWSINSTVCGFGGTSACTAQEAATAAPIPWERPYLYWISLFTACYDGDTYPCPGPTHTGNPGVVAHYASAPWAVNTDYLRNGYGVGGEGFPFLSSTMLSYFALNATQFSNTWAWGWGKVIQATHAAYLQYAPPWSPMTSVNLYEGGCTPTSTCVIQPNLVAAYAMAYPEYSLGSQGLNYGDLAGWAAGNTPITSNNFIAVSMQYWPYAKWLEQQTDKESAGPGSSGCTSAQLLTGLLSPDMIFATQHHTTALEIYESDVGATFDPNYVQGVTYGNGCSPYPTGYNQPMSNAAVGVPNVTGALIGNSKVLGKAQIQ